MLYSAEEDSSSATRVLARPEVVDAFGCIPRAFSVLVGIPKCKAR